ncbi:MAG: peptidylprolyl isomerase [Akkermansiaceae bacterium]
MKSILKIALLGFLTSFALAQDPTDDIVVEKKPENPAAANEVTVIMSTSMGDIHIEMDSKSAPITVENFLKYVDAEHYDGTIFHRVIGNFMIQGGGFKEIDGKLAKQKTNPPIKNESEKTPSNKRGTIAMARTSAPNSATAQFFINVVDNTFLNYPNNGGGYATFGKVTKGLEVVDKIKAAKTASKNGMANVPVETVTIKSVKRAK